MKIELTPAEIKVMNKQLKGIYNPFSGNEKEIKTMNNVIAKAHALMKERNAIDEIDEDLIQWFKNQYEKQQKDLNK